ncbi:MAG: FHA domain-containing protein [Blautia sp.]|nr:FHA domain-containing protein [Blautia sp.]
MDTSLHENSDLSTPISLIIIDTNGKLGEAQMGIRGKEELLLGSSFGENDIVIRSSIVSKSHGAFRRVGDDFYYRDLESHNGTFYDGKAGRRLLKDSSEEVQLHNGDMLRIVAKVAKGEKSILLFYQNDRGGGLWRRFPLINRETLVGRSSRCDIQLIGKGISRCHAMFVRRGGEYLLRDLGSTNGVYINRERISGEVSLHEKDVVQIMESVMIYSGGAIFYRMKTGYENALSPVKNNHAVTYS